MAAPAPAEAAAPPAGAGGSGGAQIVQQIEDLLMQLSQMEPEPEIQQAVQSIQERLEPLQQLLGKDDQQDMQSGLANPGGAAPGEEPPGGGAGGMPAGPESAGMPAPTEGGGGGGEPTHEVEIHIRPAGGGSKSFGGAKKEAMANLKEKGHFSRSTPKGEKPSTDRTKSKAKG